jgi:hypothetical protein
MSQVNAGVYFSLAARLKGLRAVLAAALEAQPPRTAGGAGCEPLIDLLGVAEDLAHLACADLDRLEDAAAVPAGRPGG